MHYLVYQITNTVNGCIYVGMHKTEDVSDGYMGSSQLLKQAYKKYGVEKFTKEILYSCSSQEEMAAKESEIVTEDFIARQDTYNLKKGGLGGSPKGRKQSAEEKAKRSRIMTGRKQSKEHTQKIREANIGLKHGPMSPEHKALISQSKSGKPSHAKGKTYEELLGSKAADRRKQASTQKRGDRNPNFGSCWIHNDSVSKLIKKHDLHTYLESGWRIGRIMYGNKSRSLQEVAI